MNPVNIAIIGTGVVGSALLNQLLALDNSQFRLIYIARSKHALISKDYSPLKFDLSWESALESTDEKTLPLEALLLYLRKSPLPVIVVDNTSSETIANFYPKFVNAGIAIATPNKKAFSSDLELWNKIFSNGDLVYHESTVGAGLPIISTINDMIRTGDKIEKIEGIFSGTLSYIFNEFSTVTPNSINFSEVVQIAQQLGYTEPDPREDLNGVDVARKVTILSRLAGFNVESPFSFPIQSLIPKPLESIDTTAEFMKKLPDYDDELNKLKEDAFKNNQILRYVGKVDFSKNSISVGIERYDMSHSFASLKGADNVIAITTERYKQPLVIQGAGAGAAVTAAGTLSDIIKLAERL
ncbi:HEL315Cp [Eremothecium sinecaudum]|uniref:Homoserine dehydrogenase n=1 Tax=Eremothecium sinecaudum TaxID=45286 RepID=A0A0X8HSD2_9SACH|nr:HEL315Cp [Eremothecium sinecaudum]AMD20966.1 HEL315Cp [Eremothecium sinecaudum]